MAALTSIGGANPNNGTDVNVDSSAGAVADDGSNEFAGTTYIQDLAGSDTLNATADSFSVGASNAQVTANLLTLAQAYAVEDAIIDYLDNPSDGYIELNPTVVYVAHSSEVANAGAIQRGVNKANQWHGRRPIRCFRRSSRDRQLGYAACSAPKLETTPTHALLRLT